MRRSRHSRHHNSNKEKQRYYLLPGQGGRAHRRKQWFILKWSIFVALVVAGIVAALMFWFNRSRLH